MMHSPVLMIVGRHTFLTKPLIVFMRLSELTREANFLAPARIEIRRLIAKSGVIVSALSPLQLYGHVTHSYGLSFLQLL